MATHEERMQILKMIEEGQITAEEGAKLLDALEATEEERAAPARWFRVRVTDMKTGKHKVNINLPLGLLNIGAKIGAKFSAPFDLDIDEIIRAVREGARGKVVDLEDTEDGERVEIYLE
jgi:DUF4097 and DUF4098 domain-containing protein YvlB